MLRACTLTSRDGHTQSFVRISLWSSLWSCCRGSLSRISVSANTQRYQFSEFRRVIYHICLGLMPAFTKRAKLQPSFVTTPDASESTSLELIIRVLIELTVCKREPSRDRLDVITFSQRISQEDCCGGGEHAQSRSAGGENQKTLGEYDCLSGRSRCLRYLAWAHSSMASTP
jgi:hypothetical protein